MLLTRMAILSYSAASCLTAVSAGRTSTGARRTLRGLSQTLLPPRFFSEVEIGRGGLLEPSAPAGTPRCCIGSTVHSLDAVNWGSNAGYLITGIFWLHEIENILLVPTIG